MDPIVAAEKIKFSMVGCYCKIPFLVICVRIMLKLSSNFTRVICGRVTFSKSSLHEFLFAAEPLILHDDINKPKLIKMCSVNLLFEVA